MVIRQKRVEVDIKDVTPRAKRALPTNFRSSTPPDNPSCCFATQTSKAMSGLPRESYPCIDVGFIVIYETQSAPKLAAIPFACCSVPHPEPYSDPPEPWRIGLLFSAHAFPEDLKREIAEPFWDLLVVSNSEDEIHSFEAIRLAALNRDHPCEGCEGTGREGECILWLRTPCATCTGTGKVSWRAESTDIADVRSGFADEYAYDYVQPDS